MKKVALKMYLVKNLGDDLFLKIISERYPNIKFYAEADINYSNSDLNYKNVKLYYHPILKLLRKISLTSNIFFGYLKKKCDYLVVLGGSMFIEHNHGLSYFRLRKKNYNNIEYFILGANFGPYYTERFYDQYYKIFRNSLDVSFREYYSKKMFLDLNNVRVNPDLIFSLSYNKPINNNGTVIFSIIDLQSRKNLISFTEDYENNMLISIKQMVSEKKKVILMSFCEKEGDMIAIQRIYSKLNSFDRQYVSIYNYQGNIEESLSLIANCDTIIGARFHSVILGLLFQKTVVPISYSQKTINTLIDLNYQGKVLEFKEIKNWNITDIIYYNKKIKIDINQVGKMSINHFSVIDQYLNEGE